MFDQNHGLAPLENIQFFPFMKYIFYSQARPLFYLEHLQTSFLGLFSIKTNNEESSNFSPKSWVNPLGKYLMFRLYEIHFFKVKQGFFSVSNIPKRDYQGLFSIKPTNDECSKFGPKLWLNPFGKYPIFRLYKNTYFFIV